MWVRVSLTAAGSALAVLPLLGAGLPQQPSTPAPAAAHRLLQAPAAPIPPLTAYTDRGFAGPWQSFGAGVFDAARQELGAAGNDMITSLRVATGYRALACAEGGSGDRTNAGSLGVCRYFDAGVHDYVGADLNDRISLLAVFGAPVRGAAATVYQGARFAGNSLRLGAGGFESTVGDLERVAGSIRSIKVAEGHRVVMCDKDGTAATTDLGLCRLFTQGQHASVGADLERKVSLIAVGAPALIATNGIAMTGDAQQMDAGIFQASTGQLAAVGDNAITSLQIADGYHVLACRDDAPSAQTGLGICRAFGAGEHDLTGTRLDNSISLVAVQAGTSSGAALAAYRDRSFVGTYSSYGPGIYTAAELGPVGNDAITSLRLTGQARAVLCEHDATTWREAGTCQLFTAGEHSYVGAELNDRTSLIAVAS